MNDDDDEPSRPAWAHWVTYGTLALAALALAYTIYSVGPSSILIRLGGIGAWFFAVIALEAGVTLCDAAVLFVILGPGRQKLGYRRAVMAQVSARAVNAVTPLGSLGEVVKTTMLLERVSQARALSAVLLYNLANLELSFILISVGATLTGLLLDMPSGMRTLLLISGGVAAALALAIPIIISRGMLGSVLRLGRRLHVITKKREQRWGKKLDEIDAKMRDIETRRHDIVVAGALMLLSRLGSWSGTALLIHASGGGLSWGFLAAVLTAGQVIGWASSVVPLGLGITEGGNYGLFAALGHEPGIGVTVALGKRISQIIYAAIGLVLVSVNQTVREAKEAADRRKRRKSPVMAEPGGPTVSSADRA